MSAGKDLARHRITGASLEVRLASYRIYGFLVALLFFFVLQRFITRCRRVNSISSVTLV